MKSNRICTGTGVAMVTPFRADGTVDYPRLERHTEELINHGIEYLVVLGTTAETPTLSSDEKTGIVDSVKKVNGGRVPLIVGAGGNDTAGVIEWIRKTGSSGISAYLSVAPYYNKPSQRGMKEHFSAIAASSDLPLVLYNVPGRTGSNITAETTLELAWELGESILAIKEASGDLAQVMKIIASKPESLQVISGDDAIALPMIALGGEGVISVIGNAYPSLLSDLIREALAGKYETARIKHYALLPLVELIFREGNPTGIKALMEVLGFGEANLRLPLVPASKSLYEDLKKNAAALR